MKYRKMTRFLATAFLMTILIGVHNGKIALWKEGEAKPFQVFPYPVAMLPDQQEALVRKGIRVESMEQLQQMLEAYLS